MYIKTPSKITNGIIKFCKTINPLTSPVYVPVVPISGAIQNECFQNVDKKIESNAGSKVHGWTIWEWKGVFYEAEFHAIWQSPKGGLVDVSLPSGSKEKRRLFLPNPSLSFKGRWVNNIRKPLRNDPVIQEFINAFDERIALMERYSLPGEFGPVSIPIKEAMAIKMKIEHLEIRLLQLPIINPKDNCFCGSGMPYKHCCL